MLSASSPPVLRPSPPQFTISRKTSAPPPLLSVRFRQSRVSAAYASASAERSSSTCLCPPKPASSSSSLYDVLRIPVGATGPEIKAAYRRLARMCHPDVTVISRNDSSADEFMKIHDAYSTLADPAKRADYDRKFQPLRRSFGSYSSIRGSPASSTSRFSGNNCRNWETDQCW